MKSANKYFRLFMSAIMLVVGILCAFPQSNKGTISPVESDDAAPPKPVLHYYDKHGEKLEKPVLFLAELDTVSSVRPKSPYPLFNGFSVGVNFADAILSAIGQKHQSYDVSAMVSLHNWFFPVLEAGIGWGHHTENNDLFKIKAHPSMYAKVGLNYNFLYKSDPAYMAYLGLRFGVAQCKWDKTDIRSVASDDTSGSDAGGESGSESRSSDEDGQVKYDPDQLGLKCTSIYGEILAGLKVKIFGPFSLGWNVRYRLGLHHSGGLSPWFVPGYGTGPLGFTFNAYLTFGEKKKKNLEIVSTALSDTPEN